MEDKGAILKAAQDAVLADKELQPDIKKVIKTHCNQALRRVALAVGCGEFPEGMPADDMCALMDGNASGRWKKVDGRSATIYALGGGLAVAAMTSKRLEETHGHVASVYPRGTQRSASLAKDVPMLANVGVTVGVELTSAVFPVKRCGEPEYYIWTEETA